MIIKEISTRSFDASGKRPYLIRKSKDYPPEEWEKILPYLQRNAKAHLLTYEIIAQ